MEAEKLWELRVAGNQVLLRIKQPEHGRKANLSDIQRELRRRDVPYRHEILFDIYRRASNQFEPLSFRDTTEYELQVEVSEDAQQAWMTVIPPEVGQDELTPAKIKEALEQARVEKGIRYDEIKRILRDRVENERVLIAQGRPRKESEDGWIEFVSETNEGPLVEENWADFRERGLIRNVYEGDLIARIHYPVGGEDGFDVHARVLKARPGRNPKIKLGKNVRLDESRTEIHAIREGYVVRSGDRVSVENVLDLPNVDGETGNIHFHGVVRVRGQVEDMFVVDAEKGIDIDGSVGKATLRTRGDIKVGGGAFGADIQCEGHLHARFLSECQVHAEGSVVVDEYILHSQVVAGEAVRVNAEPKGFITGGMVRAGSEIITPIVGAAVSEEPTLLEVGSGVDVRKSYENLAERMDTNLEVFDKVRRNLAYLQKQRETEGRPEGQQAETFRRMIGSGLKLRDELLAQVRRYHKLQKAVNSGQGGTGAVLVSQNAYPGVTIALQRMKQTIREPRDGFGLVVSGGELRALPYGQALKVHKQQQGAAQRRRAS